MIAVLDPYDALGVKPDATEAEIRQAYRWAARRWHPDRAGGDATRFAAVAAAYAVLSDPARRAEHDRRRAAPDLSAAARFFHDLRPSHRPRCSSCHGSGWVVRETAEFLAERVPCAHGEVA